MKQKEVQTTDLAELLDDQINQASAGFYQDITEANITAGLNNIETSAKAHSREHEDSEVENHKHNKDKDIDPVEDDWIMVPDGKGTPPLKRGSSKGGRARFGGVFKTFSGLGRVSYSGYL